jgi:hypothetical protein
MGDKILGTGGATCGTRDRSLQINKERRVVEHSETQIELGVHDQSSKCQVGNGGLRATFASPGDPISLDEYSNSPREAAPSGDRADFEVRIVSQMSETKIDDIRGDLCHPLKIIA